MSKNNILLIITAVVIGGVLLYFSMASRSQPPSQVEEKIQETVPVTAVENKNIKEFTLEAANYAFSVREIRVKVGDTVKIVLDNKEGFHDWVIDEFSARTKQISAGAADSVEFTASRKGTFEYYCSVGNHREMGMVGKLIVE